VKIIIFAETIIFAELRRPQMNSSQRRWEPLSEA
jgi:hypothetical protein